MTARVYKVAEADGPGSFSALKREPGRESQASRHQARGFLIAAFLHASRNSHRQARLRHAPAVRLAPEKGLRERHPWLFYHDVPS